MPELKSECGVWKKDPREVIEDFVWQAAMEDFDPLEVKEECTTIKVDSNTLKTEEHEKPEIKEEIKEPFSEITG